MKIRSPLTVSQNANKLMFFNSLAGEMIPLAIAPEGRTLRIVFIRGGKGVMRRLADLGLIPGATVRVIHSMDGGPILLEVKGSRIALGRGICMKILVKVE